MKGRPCWVLSVRLGTGWTKCTCASVPTIYLHRGSRSTKSACMSTCSHGLSRPSLCGVVHLLSHFRKPSPILPTVC
ncbi:hypothetical protein BDW71DRAFT_186790 [Aspergillus fruticulosus]